MPGGMFVGTCSEPLPSYGFSTPLTIDVAQASSDYRYQGYMEEDTYVASTFDSVPAGYNCWRWTTCTSSQIYLCGSDLNQVDVGGDPNDPYVIIQVCQDVPSVLYSPWIFVDDITIAIY